MQYNTIKHNLSQSFIPSNNIHEQLINIINLKHLTGLDRDAPIPKYNQLLLDRYSDTTFSLEQITKQHQQCNHAWNCISDQPNRANDYIF